MRITRELRARLGAIPRVMIRREAARFMHAAKNCRSAQADESVAANTHPSATQRICLMVRTALVTRNSIS